MNSFFITQFNFYYDFSELFSSVNKKLKEMRKTRIKAEVAEQARREKIIQSIINVVFKQQEKIRHDKEYTRLKKTIERARLKAFSCCRCFAKYFSNIKLHKHIRNHHKRFIFASSISSISSSSTSISTVSKLSFASII